MEITLLSKKEKLKENKPFHSYTSILADSAAATSLHTDRGAVV